MLGEALILGSAGIFSPIVGQGIYNRRKDASERLQGLEADLQELEGGSVSLSTGREFLDGDRVAFSSKTLDARVDVDVDFMEYDSVEDVLDEEDSIGNLTQNILSNMKNEYEPFNSKIDRYNIEFRGETGSLNYSVADTDFFDEFNEDGDRELRSAGEVYDETIGDNVDEYWSLN
jgi:ASC-1-like (ASCH) protein